jgi:hypothetical protein
MGHRWFMYESTQVIYESYINLYRALMNPLWIPSSPHKKKLNLGRPFKVPNQCPRNLYEHKRACIGHLWLMYESNQIINESYMILHKALMNHIWILSRPQEKIQNLDRLFEVPNQCTRGVCRSHMGMNRSSMIHLCISTDHVWIIYELLQNICES